MGQRLTVFKYYKINLKKYRHKTPGIPKIAVKIAVNKLIPTTKPVGARIKLPINSADIPKIPLMHNLAKNLIGFEKIIKTTNKRQPIIIQPIICSEAIALSPL